MLLYLWMMVQIICESLPISSSGHVVVLQKIIENFYPSWSMPQDLWAFDYFLQGISAVIIFAYFFPRWWQLIVNKPIQISSLWDAHLWKKTIPAVFVFGFVADAMTFLLWNLDLASWPTFSLAFGFVITSAVLRDMQYMHPKKDINLWSWKNGVIVGLMQGCALLPGISRFAITIGTLQWLGYPGRIAFAISFLLQWPLIVAGSIAGFYSLHDASIVKTICTAPFIMVTLFSGCIAYALLCWVGKLIDKNLLWKFSYYMIIPIVVALLV